MNSYICTAKIVEEPKWLRFNNAALSKIILVRPNNRRIRYYYSIRAIAKGKVAKTIFDNYKKNDFVIVEGYIYIKKNSAEQKSNKNKYKVKKYIAMKIQKVHPVSVGLQ